MATMIKQPTTTETHVYSVMFFGAPFPTEAPRQRFFLFSSLSAIYEVFTPEQVGVSLKRLYNLRVSGGTAYSGKRCIIRREKVYSKKQQSLNNEAS